MPIVIPTADEIAVMDARQKQAWRKRMGVTQQQVAQSVQLLTYGSVVMSQARLWADIYGPDAQAELHQAQLLEAINA
jgi:hypothetical protein